MLVQVSSPMGWIEKDVADNVAVAMLNGGTARAIDGDVRETEIVTVKHNAARFTGHPTYTAINKAKERNIKKAAEIAAKNRPGTPGIGKPAVKDSGWGFTSAADLLKKLGFGSNSSDSN